MSWGTGGEAFMVEPTENLTVKQTPGRTECVSRSMVLSVRRMLQGLCTDENADKMGKNGWHRRSGCLCHATLGFSSLARSCAAANTTTCQFSQLRSLR